MNDADGLEGSPETVSYRYYRRVIWQAIRSKYAEALADAAGGGVVDEAARQSAARVVQGDVRSLMTELLTHAPVPSVIRFLAVARDWGTGGGRILEQDAAVVDLIEAAHPQSTWTSLPVLDHLEAEDDTRWTAWTTGWVSAFGATGQAAQEALAGKPATAPQGRDMRFSTLQAWAPWLISAATILGATAVVVAATRE